MEARPGPDGPSPKRPRGRSAPSLLDEAVAWLRGRHGPDFRGLTVAELVVGVFATGVKLSNGWGGVAYTPPQAIRQAGRHILGHGTEPVRGSRVAAVLSRQHAGPFAAPIRLAVVNALSAPLLRQDFPEADGDEAAAFRRLVAGRRVCMVGAIIPLLRLFATLEPAGLTVVDRKASTLDLAASLASVTVSRSASVLAECQTAILTGAALANGTLPGLLRRLSPDAAVAVVGPTAGGPPQPLFRRQVALVATAVVTDPGQALAILAEGGGIHHLLRGCLRKLNLPNRRRLEQLGLDSRHPEQGKETS